jgi:hypothetical protein
MFRTTQDARLDAKERGEVMRAAMEATELLLEKYGPADFDEGLDTFEECIELVTVVEIRRAWASSYRTINGFYKTHEDRHPRIRVYSAARQEKATTDPSTSTETPTQQLDRLWRAHKEGSTAS